MGFVERMFQAAYDRLLPEMEGPPSDSAIVFSPLAERLSYLAASISSLKIVLQDAPHGDGQGWGLHGSCLFLPRVVQVFATKEENYHALKFRLIVELLSIEQSKAGDIVPGSYHFSAARMGHLRGPLADTPFGDFVVGVAERIGVVAQTPGPLVKQAQSLLAFSAPAIADVRQIALASQPGAPGDAADGEEGSTVLRRKVPTKSVRHVELKEEDMNPLVHTFEKVHTLDDYSGGNKQIDEADELKAHARALEDLDLNTVVRTDRTGAGSIDGQIAPNAEFGSQQLGADFPKTFRYGEWNGKQSRYQTDWCQVHEYPPRHSAGTNGGILGGDENAGSLSHELAQYRGKGKVLEQRLAYFLNCYRWQRRQTEGPELDLCSFIDSRVEQLRGGQPSDGIFLGQIKTDLDFALTVLCDSSLSTDAWILGKQVHKIVREAAMVLSYGLSHIECQWSVAAFSSHTRHECNYRLLKDFRDPAENVRSNIESLKPDGYTRIGPAVRHAGYRLGQLRVKRKMLIVLTDGKPTDYDHYEGSYGVQDVKRAVSELRARSIHSYAISIADGPSQRAKQMFGAATGACANPTQLSEILFGFFSDFVSKGRR